MAQASLMQRATLLDEAAVRTREAAAGVGVPEAAAWMRKAADALVRAAAAITGRSLEGSAELDGLIREVFDIAALWAEGGIEARVRRAQAEAFDALGRLLDEDVRAAILWCEPLSDIGTAMRHFGKAVRSVAQARTPSQLSR